MLKKIAKISPLVILAGTLLLILPTKAAPSQSSDTTFSVNVKEVLTVSITTPSNWASGNIGEFLRNIISLNVTSNNSSGFTATMIESGQTGYLVNRINNNFRINTLPANSTYTCNSATCPNFPSNQWGYSLDDEFNTGTYKKVPYIAGGLAVPDTILSRQTAGNSSQNIYFGAKANMEQAAGTYYGTVLFNVVSGPSGDNTPSVGPGPEKEAQYNSTADATVYTYTTGNTTTTQVSSGNNVDAYTGYEPPQGVIEDSDSNVQNGSLITTILATTASIAAGSGLFFFILAKRKKDDEEDEEEETA